VLCLHRWELFQLFYFLKTYPTQRHYHLVFGVKTLSNSYCKLFARMQYLASRMLSVLDYCWDRRKQFPNPVVNIFGDDCFGCVDTFPIYVRRPKKRAWRRALYNGKYKSHVVKVQIIGGFAGVPLFLSGPHPGTPSDIELWRRYSPDLSGDRILGDKAYVVRFASVARLSPSQGADDVLAPHKKPKGGALTQRQTDFNVVHRYAGLWNCV
jgi:hypothetical protein